LRKARESFERSQRHEMAEMSANSHKHKKLTRGLEADGARLALASDAQNRQLGASMRASRDSQDRALVAEMGRVKTASLRAGADDRRAKDKAQAGRVGSYDSPYAFNASIPEGDESDEVGTLNALLRSAGLSEYLAVMAQRGCTRPEDLAMFSVADIQGMVRGLLRLRFRGKKIL
jgi:hypothetical protein